MNVYLVRPSTVDFSGPEPTLGPLNGTAVEHPPMLAETPTAPSPRAARLVNSLSMDLLLRNLYKNFLPVPKRVLNTGTTASRRAVDAETTYGSGYEARGVGRLGGVVVFPGRNSLDERAGRNPDFPRERPSGARYRGVAGRYLHLQA